jgi:capsular exopolysaccharide synthesis family protein
MGSNAKVAHKADNDPVETIAIATVLPTEGYLTTEYCASTAPMREIQATSTSPGYAVAFRSAWNRVSQAAGIVISSGTLQTLKRVFARVKERLRILRPSIRTGNIVDRPSDAIRPLATADQRVRKEEYKLVQHLFLQSNPPAEPVIVFSGIDHASGCTSICARAADALATLSNGTVCVVDANFRNPSMHRYFNLDNRQGLSTAARRTIPLPHYLQHLAQRSLWVLTSGPTPTDPEALLASAGLRECLSELRATFDYILIDSPPLDQYPDASLLGCHAGGIVVVVAASSTRWDSAARVKDSLDAARVPILAAVLNQESDPIPEVIQQYL